MSINYCKIGKKIKELRKKKNLTQEALAEMCDLSTSYISFVENGRRKISLAKLEKLAYCLDFEVIIQEKTTNVNSKNYHKKQYFLNKIFSFIESELDTYICNYQ